jgi:hypothetical protein
MTKAAVKSLLTVTFAVVILALSSVPSPAQYGSLPIGTMMAGTSEACPGGGWYFYTDSGGHKHYVNCFSTTVTGCAHAQDEGLDYGYLNPVGIVPGVGTARGVIVLHNGGDGETPTAMMSECRMEISGSPIIISRTAM